MSRSELKSLVFSWHILYFWISDFLVLWTSWVLQQVVFILDGQSDQAMHFDAQLSELRLFLETDLNTPERSLLTATLSNIASMDCDRTQVKIYTQTLINRFILVYSVTVEASTNARYFPGITKDMSTDAEPLLSPNRIRVIEERPTSVTIEWDVPRETKCSNFLVEYRLGNGVWQSYDRRVPCSPGRITYTSTVSGLPVNSAVDLRVVTISPQNQPSPPSQEVRAHTKCAAPDSPPQGIRVDAPSQNEVRVSWSRPPKNT